MLAWDQISCVLLSVLLCVRPVALQELTLACSLQKAIYLAKDCYSSRDDKSCQTLLETLQTECGLYICAEGESQIESCYTDSCPDGYQAASSGICGRGDDCCYLAATKCEDLSEEPQYDMSLIKHELGFVAMCDAYYTIIQRRTSGDQSFDRTFAEYENGFGNEDGYWLGLKNIRALLERGTHMARFEFNTKNGTNMFAEYNKFDIGPASGGYRLSVKHEDYNTNTSSVDGSGLEQESGMMFSTKDHDRDTCLLCNCAILERGGWWYSACGQVNLNGRWRNAIFGWGTGWMSESPLSFTKIKIRLVTQE